jgi:hypothetical protein
VARLSTSELSKSLLDGELDCSLIQGVADGIQNSPIEYLLLNLEAISAHMRAVPTSGRTEGIEYRR